MKPPEGKNHDKMVAAEILDTSALGEDLKEIVEANLDILATGIVADPSDLVEDSKFYNAIKTLNNLANAKSQYQVLNFEEIAFITDILHEFDQTIQHPKVTAEMLETAICDLQSAAKRILKAFTLSNPQPEESATEVSAPSQGVINRFAKLFGLSHDK